MERKIAGKWTRCTHIQRWKHAQTFIVMSPGAITAIEIFSLIKTCPHSVLVVTGSTTGQVALWQANTASIATGDETHLVVKPTWVSLSHAGSVSAVATGCFGSPLTVTTTATDSTVCVWQLDTGWLGYWVVGVIGCLSFFIGLPWRRCH